MEKCAQKLFDRANIVRDVRQPGLSGLEQNARFHVGCNHVPAFMDSDGTQAGSPLVLDVAKRLRVFAVDGVRFVRGTARYRTWCEVNTVHLVGHPAPCKGSSHK